MISGFDFTTPLPIADAVARELRAQPDRRSAGRGLPGARRRALSGYRRAEGRVGARDSTTSCRARASRGSPNRRPRCAAAMGCSTTCSARTASTRTRPATRASTALTPSLDNGQTFVATLANPFPNGLLEPVGSGLGLMTNVGLERQLPVRRRCADAAHAPLVDWRSARAAVDLPGRRHLRRLASPQNIPVLARAELGAGQVLLHVARARRCDEQLPDAAGRRIRSRACCRGRRSTARTVARSQLLRPYPAVHQQRHGQSTRSRRSARPTTRRSRDASSGAWPTASPCRSATPGRRP